MTLGDFDEPVMRKASASIHRYQELEKQKENGQAGDLLSTATFLEGGAGAASSLVGVAVRSEMNE